MENCQSEARRIRVRSIALIFIALFFFLFIGPIAAQLIIPKHSASLVLYLKMHIPYIFLFLTFIIGTRLILKRSLTAIIAPGRKIKGMLIAIPAFTYLLFVSLCSLILPTEIHPSHVGAGEFLSSILPVLILTTIQSISEEILFRALPFHVAYPEGRNEKIAEGIPFMLFSGIIFTIPHLWNTEVINSQNFLLPVLCYFSWGALAAFLSLATGGFEATSAMHAVNNLYIALVVNYQNSSMPVKALFIAQEAGDVETLLQTWTIFVLTYILLRHLGLTGKGGLKWPKEERKQAK